MRGFTLIEVLAAAAIAVVLAVFLLGAIETLLHMSGTFAQRFDDEALAGDMVDRWQAEEDSAWAIFTPPSDILNQPNGDGHELDFFNRDGQNRPYFWCYLYDKNAQALQRYLYTAPGSPPVADGPAIQGISAFTARTYPITALQDSSTPIYSALYQTAALQPATVHFFFAQPWIAGGNQITYVRIEGVSFVRELQLATQTAPSGFTVVLRYTPSPCPGGGTPPSCTAPALSVDPARLVFTTPVGPVGGNGLGCDGTYAYANRNGAMSLDANDSAIGTDANGCFTGPNGPNVVVSEDGSHSYLFSSGSCANGPVAYGGFTPPQGPASMLPVGIRSTPDGYGCTFFAGSDDHPAPSGTPDATTAQPVAVQVEPPCYFINGSCSYGVAWPADSNVGCDPSDGSHTSGYTGSGLLQAIPTGLGTLTPAGLSTGAFTFTRTAAGAVTITERAQYQNWLTAQNRSGGYSCTQTTSFHAIGSFTIDSQ